MARFSEDGIRTSFLSVPDAASLEGVGLPFVGEVMGSMVQQITWFGTGGVTGLPSSTRFVAGRPLTTVRPMPSVVASGDATWGGYGPYVAALYTGYRTAIARMVAEATAMGAVGVVGVTVTRTDVGNASSEFMALGTAVGADVRVKPDHPFVTDLSGADVSKALQAGWVPVSLAYGISVASLNLMGQSWSTLNRQMRRWSGNVEVDGLSELVGKVRADARNQFRIDAERASADAAIVSSMSLEILDGEDGSVLPYSAEAVVTGSTLARFRAATAPPTRTLTVLPLRQTAPSTGAAS